MSVLCNLQRSLLARSFKHRPAPFIMDGSTEPSRFCQRLRPLSIPAAADAEPGPGLYYDSFRPYGYHLPPPSGSVNCSLLPQTCMLYGEVPEEALVGGLSAALDVPVTEVWFCDGVRQDAGSPLPALIGFGEDSRARVAVLYSRRIHATDWFDPAAAAITRSDLYELFAQHRLELVTQGEDLIMREW